MNKNFSKSLLGWYEKCGRDLPWRVKGGAHYNPYVVLVSEIMLQQTTVKTVLSYFDRFISRFGNVEALANADLEEVYLYWQGLGYYTRAKSLWRSANMIVHDFKGVFPRDKKDVLKLKGFGPYTVASFMAFAYNAPETVIDGNVIRVISRLYHLTKPQDEEMPKIKKYADELTDQEHSADYASAMMDLGATVCLPKKPACDICPISECCLSKGAIDVEDIPPKKKLLKKVFNGYVYLIENDKGDVLIRKRTEKGLLSGLYEFIWSEKPLFKKALDTKQSVSHVFTHINMNLKIYKISQNEVYQDGFFVAKNELQNYAFSTLMQKVMKKHGLIKKF